MIPAYLEITPLLGELVWEKSPSDELLSWQLGYLSQLETLFSDQLLEIRQGFTRIGLVWKREEYQKEFKTSFFDLSITPHPLPVKIWEVPVCYEGPYSPDLSELAEQKKITPSQVIQLHSSQVYRIHFFGFLPGFFYLNGLPEILQTPRKAIPSISVPKGSVAIGGAQTGIYPNESPGGWHLIGSTPISLFEPSLDPPVWAKVGEQIQFKHIGLDEFESWSEPLFHFKKP